MGVNIVEMAQGWRLCTCANSSHFSLIYCKMQSYSVSISMVLPANPVAKDPSHTNMYNTVPLPFHCPYPQLIFLIFLHSILMGSMIYILHGY